MILIRLIKWWCPHLEARRELGSMPTRDRAKYRKDLQQADLVWFTTSLILLWKRWTMPLVCGWLLASIEPLSKRYVFRGQGQFRGVCFAAKRQMFETIGFSDPDRRLGGRKDVEYLMWCLQRSQNLATVGDALLHHFGTIPQKMVKQETGLRDFGDLNYFYRKLGMSWWDRKRFKHGRQQQARAWIRSGTTIAGYSMHMQQQQGQWSHAEYL